MKKDFVLFLCWNLIGHTACPTQPIKTQACSDPLMQKIWHEVGTSPTLKYGTDEEVQFENVNLNFNLYINIIKSNLEIEL